MKYCPICHNSYADDNQQFCFQDGTLLSAAGGQNAETPTVVLDETETIVRNAPRPAPRGESVPPNSPAKNSNTLLVVLLTVLIMVIIFGFAGVGIWAYLSGSNKEKAKNVPASFNSNSDRGAQPSPARNSPTPSPTLNIASTPFQTDPDVDSEKVKSEVQKKIYLWKSLSEARDLASNMENYADHVDYYRAKNASRDFIRNDKQRASSLFDTIRIDITNLRIIPDPGGEKAAAVFDKGWDFTGPGRHSSGKVQQRLLLEKIGGQWFITAEKDLKLYYKN